MEGVGFERDASRMSGGVGVGGRCKSEGIGGRGGGVGTARFNTTACSTIFRGSSSSSVVGCIAFVLFPDFSSSLSVVSAFSFLSLSRTHAAR